MLVPKEQTTFEPYVPERYSKSKRYINDTQNITMLSQEVLTKHSSICKNCHQSYGQHFKINCPATDILQ